MGLFRRGTKLLRLGSGLRDCCCRPEKPEECFCPDWCRYYVDFDGTTLLPPEMFLTNQCNSPGSNNIYERVVGTFPAGSIPLLATAGGGVRYGSTVTSGYVIDQIFLTTASVGFNSGGLLSYSFANINGPLSQQAEQEIFGTNLYDQGIYLSCSINRNLYFAVLCVDGNSRFLFNARVIESTRIYSPYYFGSSPYYVFPYYYIYDNDKRLASPGSNGIELDAEYECGRDIKLFCNNYPALNANRRHLLEDVEFVFDEDGLIVNGSFYEWQQTLPNISGNVIDNRNVTDLWRVPGDFPSEATFTLKRRESCRTGTCDCSIDPTGREVQFEGQTFTYGSNQEFISEDGLTIWEELFTGTFTRTDRRECDPTVVTRVRRAQVACGEFDGVPRWYVLLDSECYEREEAGCNPVVTATKITLWDGALFCDEDGNPFGSPHSFEDDSLPPELDQETTSGTPSGECSGDNPIPSFSISLP